MEIEDTYRALSGIVDALIDHKYEHGDPRGKVDQAVQAVDRAATILLQELIDLERGAAGLSARDAAASVFRAVVL